MTISYTESNLRTGQIVKIAVNFPYHEPVVGIIVKLSHIRASLGWKSVLVMYRCPMRGMVKDWLYLTNILEARQ